MVRIRTQSELFDVPLYTVTEAAHYLRVGRSTVDTWARGYVRTPRGKRVVGKPVITTAKAPKPGYPTVPFGGLAEAYVLRVFREAGVPLQRIRPSLARPTAEFGPHALASSRLATDGAEVLWQLGEEDGASASDARAVAAALVVPRTGQRVFMEVVQQYLTCVTFDETSGWATAIRLPWYETARVVLDPGRGFGRPVFLHGGARVEDAVGPVRAGDSLEHVAREYGVPVAELREAVALAA